MADRYWVGGSGTWNTTSTTNWSAASALSFTASCSGTTLTTTGSPALVNGMTVWAANNTSLGTITGGSGNTWTVSVGGTFASQTMTAATTGASVPTTADSVFFDANSSGTNAYTVTLTGALACLDFNNTARTPTVNSGTSPSLNVAGSFTLNAGAAFGGFTVTFSSTTTGRTINTNGVQTIANFTFNGVGGGWTLGSALDLGTGAITITAGALNTSASNYAITAVSITATSVSTASLTLNGSTVNISSSATAINFSGAGFTLNAGTSQINLTGATGPDINSSGHTFYNVAFTGAATASTSLVSITGANTFNNLSFTAPANNGVVMAVTFAANQTINGSFTTTGSTEIRRLFFRSSLLGTTRTLTLTNPTTISNADFRDITAATNAITATSGGGDCGGNTNITFPAPKTVYWNLIGGSQNWSATGWATTATGTPAAANFPLAQDTATITDSGGVPGTLSINAPWNIGTIDMSGRTGAMTLATGTETPFIYGNWLNGTGITLTGTGVLTFTARGGTQQISGNGVSFTQPITANNIGGTVRLASAVTLASTVAFTLTNGTLDLQSFTLTAGAFASSNSNTRTLAFGTGNITVNGTGSLWDMSVTTGITITGTSVVNVSNSTALSASVTPGSLSEANSINFNFTTGPYILTLNAGNYGSLNFTGFAGITTVAGLTIYGSLTLSTGMTLNASGTACTFASTSATPRTITTNGKTMNLPITFNGVGGSWVLQDALTMGSTVVLTHTNGTLDLSGKTLTVGTRYATAAGTKNLTFNGGTLVCPAANTTSFNNAAPTNFTTTAGTGAGFISMTAATAKTFVGGGSTFNCTLNQGGAGALTITGANTFANISNTVQPATITFPASTTTTVQAFTVSGTSGNLITLQSSVAGTRATLSDASGTINVSFCSIKDINATGGATWNASTSNGNVDAGNNLGWNFAAGAVSVTPTGVFASGVIGTATVAAAANILTTGPPGTGAVGTVDVSTPTNVTLTGVSATGSTGFVETQGLANVTLTGVSAAGSVGTVATSAAASVSVTGVSATGSVGTLDARGTASVTLTGVSATGAVGTVETQARANVTLIGVEATGSAGTAFAAASTNAALTGVGGAGQVGTLDARGTANVTLTGVAAVAIVDGVGIATGGNISVDPGDVSAVGLVGTPDVAAKANTTLTGVEATGAVGSVSVASGYRVTGVSADGLVGTVVASVSTSATVTGVFATGSVGTVGTQSTVNIIPTGVSVSGLTGTLDARGKANTTLTGVSATGEVGTIVSAIPVSVTVTGVSATGSVGTVDVAAAANVTPTGVSATGETGTLDAQGKANVTVTGVEATGAVGTVTTRSAYSVTGVSATGSVDSVTVSAKSTVVLTGVVGTGIVAKVLVWGQINDNQDPNWQPVDDSQSPAWSAVNDGNTVVWTQIPT